MSERITCHNCKYCKIWYDKDTSTMRMSCMKKTWQGRTITWSSYPTFTNQNGIMVQTEDTKESIVKEFEEHAKRRLAPSWCEYRKTNTQPERIINIICSDEQEKSILRERCISSYQCEFLEPSDQNCFDCPYNTRNIKFIRN